MEIITFIVAALTLVMTVLIISGIKKIQTGAEDVETPAKIDALSKQMTDANYQQIRLMSEQKESTMQLQNELLKENRDAIDRLKEQVSESLKEMQTANEQRMDGMQKNINEKLDTSLNKRLDENFRQVGEQLQALYRSLGEIENLSAGVSDLQRTLSNVKRRGIFGEVQLGNILEDVFDASQYDTNIITKKNSNDPVEYALRIPDKDGRGGFIWLPIDSKFPADIYDRLMTAVEDNDAAGMKAATKELEQRIKTEAMTIRDKYLDPPRTTDFAVMFLPTEGLYAEVIRIPGLMETCQDKRVVISGPSTLVALLNSLSLGFRYLTVNRNSQEVLKTLSAINAQYDKFKDLIDSAQKKLDAAQKATAELSSRNEIIRRKLGKIEKMDTEEADTLLGMSMENIDGISDS